MLEAPRIVRGGATARGALVAPPSKSHAIRLLAVGALCPEGAAIAGLGRPSGVAEDIRCVVEALDGVHRGMLTRIDGRIVLRPRGERGPEATDDVATSTAGPTRLRLGGSATALRLLCATCALEGRSFELDGDESLRARPVGSILDALRALGVDARAVGPDGRPPVRIGGGLTRGGVRVAVDGTRSSQAVSALIAIGPRLAGGLVVDVAGPLVSAPYVDLTIAVVRAAGGSVEVSRDPRRPSYAVGGRYARLDAVVEGDWSGAAYPLAAAAATGGDVAIRGLLPTSVQADRRIVSILEAFGARAEVASDVVRVSGRVEHPVDLDLADAPDLAPLVGALACLAPGRSRVRGAAHLRIKESDRIAATVDGARRLGFEAEAHADGFDVVGGRRAAAGRHASVDPRGDHRIAMSFAVAGLALDGVAIAQPSCVGKSYPEFWADLDALTAS